MLLTDRPHLIPVLGLLLVLAVPPPAAAQVRVLPLDEAREDPSEIHPLRRLPRDPLTQSTFSRGAKAIENGDVTAGLETLQSLLDEAHDFFLVEGPRISGSMIAQVEGVLREHRDEYERLYGTAARQQFEQARSAQDVWGAGQVARRFALTNAGADALRHLARINSDRGDLSTAARQLEQLAGHPAVRDGADVTLQAARTFVSIGMEGRARRLLERSRERFPGAAKRIEQLLEAGDGRLLTQAADAPLRDWRLPFGGVDHAGQTSFAPAMLDDGWRAPLIHREHDFFTAIDREEERLLGTLAGDVQELAETIEKRVRSANRNAFPAGRPLIVGDLAIVPGPGSVKAYDLHSGEIRWNGVVVDQTFSYLNRTSYSPTEADDPVRDEMRQLFFTVRGWRDLTSSSISTDGKNVYAVSDCQLVGTANPYLLVQNTVRHELLPQRSNRLHAFQLETDGKNLWSIGTRESGGGAFGGDDVHDEIFFFGAPLPVDDRLYVLGEERGQIQLFEIDPQTGSILWAVGLLNPEEDLVLDEKRRLAGLMPSYGSGLLICPTGEGVVTAVDPLKRQVVWSHQYDPPVPARRNNRWMRRGWGPQRQTVRESMDELLSDERWFDTRAIVAGEYVVFTPPDDNKLVCLKIEDGSEVWSQEVSRLHMLYAGAVFDENLLLVGPSDVNALRLKDGEDVWSRPIPIPRPSGRGVRMGERFLQPLVTGEIAVIDLESGRLLCRSPLPSGKAAGNLVAGNGILLSQTATEIVGFQSLESVQQRIARQLEANPGDALARALEGELKLQQGDLARGLEGLRMAVQREAHPRARHVLSWALLDSLRHDFEKFQEQSAEIEDLLQTPEQRLQFLRIYASGLHQAGEVRQALGRYLQILEVLPGDEKLRDQDSRWSATDARWVLAGIEDLFQSATGAVRPALEQSLVEWTDELEDRSLLLWFLRSGAGEWMGEAAVLARVGQIDLDAETAHDREAVLLSLRTSRDPQVRLEATSELARLALQMKRGEAADRFLSQLESDFATETSSRGESGPELAAALRREERFSETLNGVTRWPVHVHKTDNRVNLSRSPTHQIPVLGPVSPQLEGWTFFLDQMGAHVDVFDPNGQRRSRVPTGLTGARYPMGSQMGRHVSLHGHRAVIVLVDRLILLDFLSEEQPHVVLNRELVTDADSPYGNRGVIIPGHRPVPGMRTFLARTPSNTRAGNVGPLTASLLCYGVGEELIAVDPVSGKELWKRRDLERGSEIFGDDRYVVVLPPTGNTLHVFRAADGRKLLTRPVPEETISSCLERRGADWGRFFPTVVQSEERFEWKLIDPVTGDVHWEHSGRAGTRWAPVAGQDVAFLSPENVLTLHTGLTGEELLRVEVPLDESVQEFALLPYSSQWILTTSTEKPNSTDHHGANVQQLLTHPVHGRVLAIDRAGKQVQWTREVDSQALMLEVPRRWPVLVFGTARGRTMNSLVLNRHSGEGTFEESSPNDGTGIQWQGQTQPTRIQLRFARDTVELECTDSLEPGSATKAPHLPKQTEEEENDGDSAEP